MLPQTPGALIDEPIADVLGNKKKMKIQKFREKNQFQCVIF